MTEALFLTEEHEAKWRHYIAAHHRSTIFHTLEYRDVIASHYRFTPRYIIALDNGQMTGALVAYHTKTIFGGHKLQTLPLGSYCDILADNHESLEAMLALLVAEGKKLGVDFIELKLKHPLPQTSLQFEKHSPYCTVEVDLHPEEEKLRLGYHTNIRKNVKRYWKKAEEEGITIRRMEGREDISGFYDIYLREMRNKHRSLPKAYDLILDLFDAFEKGKHIDLILAERKGRIIAGSVNYYYNGSVIYEFPAMDNAYSRLAPMDLVVDYAMRKAGAEGYKVFDFSVTSVNHKSLLDFKTKWGGRVSELPFYYHGVRTKPVPSVDYYSSYPSIRKVYRHVPLPVIRLLSPIAMRELA